MQKVIIFVFSIAVVAWVGSTYKAKREERQIISSALSSGGALLEKAGIPKSCVGKKYCITAFIAPWCGVCNQSIPAFRSLNAFISRNRADVGFGLVIGAAEPTENENKKKELSDIESYVDNDGSIMAKRQIKAFPTWIATNDQGKELFRKAAGVGIPDENAARAFVKDLIGRN